MFNLLSLAEKQATLREVRRALRPGGSFHLLDLARQPPLTSLSARAFNLPGFQVSVEEQMVALLEQAGLTGARKTGQHRLWLWPLASYRAERAA